MPDPVASPDAALPELRAEVTSDDGLVTAIVDATGRLIELRLEPKTMRKDAADLADVVSATITAAQDDAREQATGRLDDIAPPLPQPQELMNVLDGLQTTASAKLGEMSAVLAQLLDRTEGPK